MVDLPSIPLAVPQVRTPQSPVSPSDIAQPYNDLARTLDKSGEVLMQDVAKPAAHQAGLQAVTRDQDGNVQVQRTPIFGDASPEFMRAVKFSAVADGEGELKRQDIELRQKYRDDPEGYATAAEAFKKQSVENYTKIAGADVGITLGKIIDGQTTLTYRGLLNEHERLTLQRADRSIESQIQSSRDDLVAMARGGVTSGPAWDQARDKITTLTNERVANPRLAYPKEQADYDMQHLDGELKANGFLHHVEQVYKDPNGGAQAAQEEAKSVLTDPSIKLTEQQRQSYYHKALGDIHANEAVRKQDLGEVRAAASELRTASLQGQRIEPEMIDRVAQQAYKLGDAGLAARIYAWAGRAPLNDDFGRQPLPARTQQLQQLQTGFQGTPDNAAALKQAAANLGVAPRDLAAAISYETAGTFNPGIVGGAGNNYRGLIQFGPEERAKYGVTPDQSFPDQMKSVEGFLRDRGVKPGMGLPEIYKTIIGGNPNVSLNARDQNGTIAEHIQRIQSQHYGNADRFIGNDQSPAPTPAASAWLLANRSTDVQKEARAGWKQVIGEWNSTGTAPSTDAVMSVVNAARATGDHALLDQIGQDMERVQVVQEAAQGPLAGQHAVLAELRRQAASGEIQPGGAMVLKQLQAKNDAIEKGLKENPISTATANFPDRLRSPAPLNVADQGEFRAGLQQRAQIAAFAAQNWQVEALPAMDKADVQAVQATLERADPATRARIFSDITAAIPDEKVRNATFGKLAEGGPKAATQAYAGALYGQAPDVAASILRGQHAMEVDDRNNPAKEGEGKERFNGEMDKALPQGAFSLAGRTDPSGPYATMRAAAIARYADLTAQEGGKKDFSSTRLQAAVNDVTGGILDHNGGKFIAPQRGMPQAQFDRVLWSVTDADLGHGPPAGNLAAADQALHLTPQEKDLYQRHLTNLSGPGGVTNPNGSRSTLFQMSFERDGRTYNVPTVWDGQILKPDDAIKRAEAEGLSKFPSYGSQKEAEDRYQQMHAFMEKDTASFMRSPAAVTTLAGEPVTAAYLRGKAQLESYGDGRYLVRLGSDPMRPIYAVRNAATEAPQPFVLDLRGRKPSDLYVDKFAGAIPQP